MRITRTKIKTTIIEFTLLLALLQIWIIQCKKIDIKEVLSGSTTTITIYNSYQGSLAKARENQEVSHKIEGEETTEESTPSPTDIETKIRQTFKNEADIALAVAKAESSLRPDAINYNRNGTTDSGLFQINSCHGYDVEWLKNPDNNIKVAYELYKKSGWNPWSVYKNNKYLDYYDKN